MQSLFLLLLLIFLIGVSAGGTGIAAAGAAVSIRARTVANVKNGAVSTAAVQSSDANAAAAAAVAVAVAVPSSLAEGGSIRVRYETLKLAAAGGLAGGLANAILYPVDTLKTMRQADSRNIQSAHSAMLRLKELGLIKIYSGFVPAVLGAIPSSALYFGSYETSKRYLTRKFQNSTSSSFLFRRPAIHVIAAASGNIMSSFVFVPKGE